jgi:hypothetical protein
VGRVQAAANRLAQAAAAATRAAAAIRSPSRVFIELGQMMGAGLAVGMDRSESEVERAARSLTNTVIATASSIEGAFAGDAWASDFSARVDAELAAHDVGTPSAARGAVAPVVNINNYVPDAERGADKASHNMRRLSAMGLFGG